jgi:hypothetical protein
MTLSYAVKSPIKIQVSVSFFISVAGEYLEDIFLLEFLLRIVVVTPFDAVKDVCPGPV